ncbi:MAG: PIG-L family deacetylase [Anaerolineae bacterium]|nr:PIG-L family deacetylase [Anaerolineae bacterium]
MAPTFPRVLVIAAHPDDIEFGAAGTIACWTDEGAVVTFCIVTDGAAGSNEPGVDLKALSLTRQDEQRAAAAVLGVQDVIFLGYPDGTLQPTLELRRDLTRLIRQIRPDCVMIQDPTVFFAGDFYINHPDHRAAGEAALYAVFPSAGTRPIFPELLAEGYEPFDVPELWLMFANQAEKVVEISAALDRKVEALLCHKSQVGPEVGEMIREWARDDGKAHGYAAAESFRVMRLKRDPATDGS